MNLLLLGSNDRAGLSIARSLNKHQYLVHNIFLDEKTPLNYSNSVYRSSFIGNPYHHYPLFKKRLFDYVKENNIEIIFPVNDIAIDILFECKNYFEIISKLIIPNEKAYKAARNKIATIKLAEQLKIPIPKYEILESLIFQNVSFPIYLKPKSSTLIKDQTCYSFRVKQLNNKDEMINQLRQIIPISPVILQEKISGYGIGVNVFCKNGKVLVYTVNKRVHEPINGGGSSYRKTINPNGLIKKYVQLLANAMELNGAMMFEFKVTKTDYVLMEINPRLWGSLSLSKFSGVNFPLLMMGEIRPQFLKYSTNKYTRHLLKDIRWVVSQVKNTKNIIILFQWIYSFRRLFLRKEIFDVEMWNDLIPAIAQIYLIMKKFYLKVFLRVKVEIARMWKKQKPIKLFSSSKILFVCKGNINRSAFAEKYVQKNYPNCICNSAGTLLKRGRMASAKSLDAAKKYNVNLNNHLSKTIFDIDIYDYDVIIVFDWKNYFSITDVFPALVNNVFLLDANLSNETFIRPSEIKDPHNGSMTYFNKCFAKIKSSIDRLDFNN